MKNLTAETMPSHEEIKFRLGFEHYQGKWGSARFSWQDDGAWKEATRSLDRTSSEQVGHVHRKLAVIAFSPCG